MKYLGSYRNGNYKVYMFDDGTKIRANKLTTLEPDFPNLSTCRFVTGAEMRVPSVTRVLLLTATSPTSITPS